MVEKTTEPEPAPTLPQPLIEPRPYRSIWLFWLIPLVAILTGGFLGARALLAHGPQFTIKFNTAEGLEAGKTKIKYKDVDIGLIKTIDLTPDHSQVIARAELNRGLEGVLVADTKFWVVRPRIAATGVSGLGTLVSGAYVGVDFGKSSERRRDFVALEAPPVITTDLPGRQFTLYADDLSSLEIGSPVYFRRVPVGQVVGYELSPDGTRISVHVFIKAPYDRFVTRDARFWQASGLDVSLDTSGLKVNMQSLASLLIGGIAFESPPGTNIDQAGEAPANAAFRLASDRTDAYRRTDIGGSNYALLFKGSVRGLNLGATVDFRGVALGEVTDIRPNFVAADQDIDMAVTVRIYADRLRSMYRTSASAEGTAREHSFLDTLVGRGLRAQLRTSNLLTGQLYIALDFFPHAPRAQVDWSKAPPHLPTVPGTLDTLEQSLLTVAQSLEKIPFDKLGADAQLTLHDLDRAIGRADTTLTQLGATVQHADIVVKQLSNNIAPEAQAVLQDTRRTLDTANRAFAALNDTVGSDSAIQTRTRQALSDISSAARALRVLADYLERHPEALLRGKPQDSR